VVSAATSVISRADAVVVGAGAYGLSIALHLATKGLQVALVEQYEIGSQTSSRAAGQLKLMRADETRCALARLSLENVLRFEALTGVPLPVVHSGSIVVACSAGHAAMIQAEYQRARACGTDVELVDGAEAHRLMPLLEPEGILNACYTPADVFVEEPRDLLRAYFAAAVRHGVHVLSRTRVEGISLRDDRGEIETPVVVNAAGAWAVSVGDMTRVHVPLTLVRHQLCVTEPLVGAWAGLPILRLVDSAVYVRPAHDGLMMGGFESEPLAVDASLFRRDFVVEDLPLDVQPLRELQRRIELQIPALRDVELQELRGGFFTIAPDGRPLIGPSSDVMGLWFATGCNGSGFSLSPGVGQVLAEWIVEGEPPIDMTPLHPARFTGRTFGDAELRNAGIWRYTHYYDPQVSRDAPDSPRRH
jgi:glycine/D-amino acid oxidase-like deaminating enzyme